jgi:hypothetical protein
MFRLFDDNGEQMKMPEWLKEFAGIVLLALAFLVLCIVI